MVVGTHNTQIDPRLGLGPNVGENDLKCYKVFLLYHGIGMLIF